tara:strand:- start:327 stop:707 length:381 start_codon:yes stop_codon:yes gene_type:complete
MIKRGRNYDIGDVIQELYPEGAAYVLTGIEYSGLDWRDSREKPTEEVLSARLNELRAAEPMRLLREERDRRLSETDWWTSRATDGIEMTQAQKDYRKALRDLPSTASPKLDDDGNLTNVTWPTKPE